MWQKKFYSLFLEFNRHPEPLKKAIISDQFNSILYSWREDIHEHFQMDFEMDAVFIDEMENFFLQSSAKITIFLSCLYIFWIFIKFVILTPICNSFIHIALCYKKIFNSFVDMNVKYFIVSYRVCCFIFDAAFLLIIPYPT